VNESRLVFGATADSFRISTGSLPAERGPNGKASTYDFQAFELLRIVERFATGFFDLPELIPADPHPHRRGNARGRLRGHQAADC
jgi:hypothetical protein